VLATTHVVLGVTVFPILVWLKICVVCVVVSPLAWMQTAQGSGLDAHLHASRLMHGNG
jgi:hypothetical protein